ncbi:MAG: CoA transferase, partial [Hydrogenophaga sp.]|nr:CoA transferase [Hydrogenophaga sp.]
YLGAATGMLLVAVGARRAAGWRVQGLLSLVGVVVVLVAATLAANESFAGSRGVYQRIAEAVKDRDADALFELLSRHDVPVAPVVEPARLAALPQFATRDKFEAGDHMPLVRFPVPLAGMSEGVLGPAPALGSARI